MDQIEQTEPAEQTELLDDIRQFMRRYVVLPSAEHETVIAAWILHTWLFEAAQTTPYLYINSAEKASGKTRLLDVLGILARNARRADDMTASIMFKIIERERPTLLIDEVDTIWSGTRNESKRRLLCTGYKKGGCAWREQARELTKFSTFSPKVVCGIKNGFMPDTVSDRCIPIEMSKKTPGDDCEHFIEYRVAQSLEVEQLLDRIMAFREEAFVDVTVQRPEMISALSDRQNEICEPLLAIACVLECELEVRNSLQAIFRSQGSALNPIQTLLQRIRGAFGQEPKMFTEDLCQALGASYNGRMLALWLEPFGICPKDIRIGNRVLKGYVAEDFADTWAAQLGSKPQLAAVEDADGDDSEEGEEEAA